MYTLRFLPAILLVFVSSVFAVAQDEDKLEMQRTKRYMFLPAAIEYGAQQDGLSKDLVKLLRQDNSLWVGKCPICDDVREGLYKYVQDEKVYPSKASEKVLKNLNDPKKRKKELLKLVDRYVQDYYGVLEMTDDQIAEMEASLNAGRKRGMSMTSNGPNFYCASCDGACHINVDDAEAEEESVTKVSGVYSSKKGVMVPLSTFCFNCGELKTADGVIDICFDELDKESGQETDVKCKEVQLKGEMKTLENESDQTIEVFSVTELKCLMAH
jgi:hypothetical protein